MTFEGENFWVALVLTMVIMFVVIMWPRE
jgi:hypothetical protein